MTRGLSPCKLRQATCCTNPEIPSADSPPSERRYKRCRDRSDESPHNSDDIPPPHKTPAAAPPASQLPAEKPSPDPVAQCKPRQCASGRRCYKKLPTGTACRYPALAGSLASDPAPPRRTPAATLRK